jgi:hypothetical protein
LDLNKGFESEEEDGEDVLKWAEATIAAERADDANKVSKREFIMKV